MTRVNPPEADGAAAVQGPEALSARAERLRHRFEANGDGADLAEALRLGHEAYRRAEGGSDVTIHGLVAFRLGVTLAVAFARTGDPGFAEQSLVLFDAADRLLPGGHEDLPAVAANRAAVLVNRYLRSGLPGHLDAAIAESRRGLSFAPADDPRRPGWHSNLGGLLRTRFQSVGALVDIDAAVDEGRLALSSLDGRQRQPAALHAALAASLVLRFAATHAEADLAEAIETGRRALALAPEAGPTRLMALGVLAGSLKGDFERSAKPERLGEAIDCLRETTDLLPDGHADLPANLGNLADALLKRHERFAAREDVEEAVAAARRALGQGHAASEPFLRRILATALLRLGQRRSEDGETAAAIEACDEARHEAERSLDLLPPEHPDRADSYTVLGNASMIKFGAGGDHVDARNAVAAYQAAIDSTTPDDPLRPVLFANLGTVHLRTAQNLAESERVLREAVRLSRAGHPVWAQATVNLATALLRSVQEDAVVNGTESTSRSKLDEALALFAELDDTSSAPPSIRLAANRMSAIIRLAEGDLPSACTAYTAAVELLAQTAWHGLGQAVKERELADRTGLGSEAAAAFLAVGAPERALELLEQSRGVLWSQRLARRFVDVRLETALPEQAKRLGELTQALDAVD